MCSDSAAPALDHFPTQSTRHQAAGLHLAQHVATQVGSQHSSCPRLVNIPSLVASAADLQVLKSPGLVEPSPLVPVVQSTLWPFFRSSS